MPNPQPGQMEQRIADEERFARQLLARRERDLGFTGYADWLDAGCPQSAEHEYPHERIADICFYVASTRPTPDGEIGELVGRLRAPAYWLSGSSDGHEGENYKPLEAATALETQAADIARLREKKHGGENGTAGDAIDFAVGHCAPREALAFLDDWRSDRATEWPGYVQWLRVQREGAEALATRTYVR